MSDMKIQELTEELEEKDAMLIALQAELENKT